MSSSQFKYARGFFDAGLALVILALSGSAAYVIEKEHAESVPVEPPAMTAELEPPAGTIDPIE